MAQSSFPSEGKLVQFRPLLGLEILAGLALLASCTPTPRVDETRQATGVKVGEVTDTSAIVWMRVTERAERRADGVVRRGRAREELGPELRPKDLEGSVPGAPGRVRLRYGTGDDLAGAQQTGWADVSAEDDFTHKFHLKDLKPSTVYTYSAETPGPGGSPLYIPLRGRFKTAPPPEEYEEVTFTVITGKAYRDVDHEEGFLIYDSMLQLHPDFIVPTGDTVYYDSDDPRATDIDLGSVNTNGHNHVTMRRWNSRKLNTNGSRHTCRCSAATSAFRTSRCSTPSCMSPSMAANGAGYPHGLATGTPSTPA